MHPRHPDEPRHRAARQRTCRVAAAPFLALMLAAGNAGAREMASLDPPAFTLLPEPADVRRRLRPVEIQREASLRVPQARPLADPGPAEAALVEDAAAGRTDRVRTALQSGADPDSRDVGGRSALGAAIRGRHVAIVRLLLARGADPDRRAMHGLSPLTLAVLEDHDEILALLLARRPWLDRADTSGHAPLSLAASFDRAAAVDRLAAAGAPLDAPGRFGPPLVVCAEAGAARACRRLLAAGADPEVRDAAGRSPLLVAAINENAAIARALLAAGAQPGTIVLDWLHR
jgi:ankyrin repeat protein